MVISETNGRVIDASAGTSGAPMPGSAARKIGTAVRIRPSCTRSSVFHFPHTGIGCVER